MVHQLKSSFPYTRCHAHCRTESINEETSRGGCHEEDKGREGAEPGQIKRRLVRQDMLLIVGDENPKGVEEAHGAEGRGRCADEYEERSCAIPL